MQNTESSPSHRACCRAAPIKERQGLDADGPYIAVLNEYIRYSSRHHMYTPNLSTMTPWPTLRAQLHPETAAYKLSFVRRQ